jgi:hypothetical protein
MKVKNLLRSMREAAQADRIIVPGHVRRKNRNWPICLMCGREPFSVQMEDIGARRVEVRVKCAHKPYWEIRQGVDRIYEDTIRVDIPEGTERTEHIAWALKHGRFFDPNAVPK